MARAAWRGLTTVIERRERGPLGDNARDGCADSMTKKVICILMAFTMVLLVGCGAGKDDSAASVDTGSNAASSAASESVQPLEEVDILENCTLSDEEMAQVASDYFAVLQAIMTQSGDEVEFKIEQTEDGYNVFAVRGGETPQEPSLSWENVRELFRFLYSHGQVDLEGNILVTEESVLETEG